MRLLPGPGGGIPRHVAGSTQRELYQPYLLIVRQLRDKWHQVVGGSVAP
jgi:hypothetical protein